MALQNAFGDLALDASIGTDGATPPAIAGTGVRGWLRGIYEKLTGGVPILSGGVTVDGTHPLPVAGVFADANGVPYSNANPLPTNVQNLTVNTLNVSFPPSIVSTANSTSTPLAANGVFTGAWEDCLAYSAISVVVLTDVASALNGAVVDFSEDGVNVVRSVAATMPANTGLTFMFAPEARYYRLRYTNGATPQTIFRSQTLLHYQTPTPPQLPLAAATSDLSLATSTASHLKGRQSNGIWLPVKVDATGAVSVGGTVAVSNLSPTPERDVFGSAIVASRVNQVEVHFDDVNWASYVTQTSTGGADAPVQALGRVLFGSGTGINGLYKAISADVAKYRPHAEVYGGGTVAWVAPPTTAGQVAQCGWGDDTNGVFVGYNGTTHGVWLRQNGVDTFTAQSAWNIDKLDGTGASGLTLDPTKGYIFDVRAGLFGYAGAVLYVCSPYPWRWIAVHYFPWYQTSSEPFFTNYDLPMYLRLAKSGVGANDIQAKVGCWGAGTASDMSRINDPISDRTLALDVRAIQWGKATNGTYVPIAVNNQGRLQVTNDSVGATGAAAPASAALTGGTDGTNMRALKVANDGRLLNEDIYTGGEVLADQAGAGAVQTFTFSAPVQLVCCLASGVSGTARFDPFGGTPSATQGIPCDFGVPTPVPVQATIVKVYAPAGLTVSVWGMRY